MWMMTTLLVLCMTPTISWDSVRLPLRTTVHVNPGPVLASSSRRSFLAAMVAVVPWVSQTAPALAAANCYNDCYKNCQQIAPKNCDYCKLNCVEYCLQDDRRDGTPCKYVNYWSTEYAIKSQPNHS
jgi:hypothetical protein